MDQPVPERPAPSVPVAPHLRELDARLEAVLMVADGPMPLAALAAAVDRPVAVVRHAIERLRDDYDGLAGGVRRGYELREVVTGWRLGVRAEHADLVREVLTEESTARLSQAALETLAVVAYRQPVTRGQIASIRAVSVDAVVRTLVARGLIQVTGRVPETGAALYGTTDELLVALGLGSLAELPPIAPMLEDVHELADRVG
ncbi:SMC-Scp complex subunit ScpB [uncultured Amnibacterium sp.]|uniref:SMC-Scp complex subunit ScpB n=1 Tax=uncultured Amnibacterium sp. TaxID=1631851 RepID=UPI0035CC3455